MAGVPGSEDEDFLEDYYDVIVLSTGLGSSILAAALAKSGKRVLHLDRNGYYGDQMASFSFVQLLEWAERHQSNGGGEVDSVEPPVKPDYNLESVGKAIARALAREELKEKQRAEEESVSAAAAAGEEGVIESEGGVGKEVVEEGSGGRIGLESVAGLEAGNAAPCPAPAIAPEVERQQEENLGVSWRDAGEVEEGGDGDGVEKGKTISAATATTATTSATAAADVATVATVPLESKDGNGNHTLEITAASPPPEGDEGEGEDCDKGKTKENADEPRLQSHEIELQRRLQLRLLPLLHHGCRTRAGAPSDTCVQERLREKVEEGNAGHHARRRVAPSHPAWFGRRAPMKTPGGVGSAGVSAAGGEERELHPAFWGYRTGKRPDSAELVRLSRSFNLDLTSQVLLATGTAVDTLVNSGVANYLEFKDMPALYMGSDQAPSAGAETSTTTAAGLGKDAVGKAVAEAVAPWLRLSRVPCSKADVFGTKLLTPLEKRRLMKFLLFVSDWGLQRAGEDVSSRNEAGLGRGRSLRRPQNREAASGDFDSAAHAGRPFREFLESCGFSEKVRAMVTHALALLPGGGMGNDDTTVSEGYGKVVTMEEGLEAVYRHLSALGRFGETAFISPLYGTGELPQAFCRMAAVYGAVYVLRRQLKGALVDRVTGRCVGVVDERGRSFACRSLVVGGEYFIPSPSSKTASTITDGNPGLPSPPAVKSAASIPPATEANAGETPDRSGNPVPVSTPEDSPCCNRRRQRLLRRIVVASGPVTPESMNGNKNGEDVDGLNQGRGLFTLPPGLRCVGNPSAVHVVSLDESTAACPGGLDGACVLHLTTTIATESSKGNVDGDDYENRQDEDGSGGVLGRAAKGLLAAAGVHEIWSVGFSWDIPFPGAVAEDDDLPPNVVVCQRPGQELYMHDVFVDAERAFSRLCPGEPFWPSPTANASHGDDDQAEMLRAAAASAEDA